MSTETEIAQEKALEEWGKLVDSLGMLIGATPPELFQHLRGLKPLRVREFKEALRKSSHARVELSSRHGDVCKDTIRSVWALFRAAGMPTD